MSDATDRLRAVFLELRRLHVEIHKETGRRVRMVVETEDADLAIRLAESAFPGAAIAAHESEFGNGVIAVRVVKPS